MKLPQFIAAAGASLVFSIAAAAQTVGDDAENYDRAAAITREAVALNLGGRSGEALEKLQQAAALAPDRLDTTLQTAVVLDYLGRHDEAGVIFDDLFKKIQEWRMDRVRARKAGDKSRLEGRDADMLGVTLDITAHAAINNIFRGRPEQALAQFTSIYESRSATAGPDRATDNAACWRLWLTVKMRAMDGMRGDAAVEHLAKSLHVSTPWLEELVQLWLGKGHWQKVLAAINDMPANDAEKEASLTQARFMAAGYYRYVKRDNETALELLDAENARPFNGCVERLFIRREIEELRKR